MPELTELPKQATGRPGASIVLAGEQPPVSSPETRRTATIHPSAVLRAPAQRRDEIFDGLVADLELAGRTFGDPQYRVLAT